MACKRIIGVLTVRHDRLVKSYGYGAWRPAGDLTTALQNLDRWAADEVVVLDISRRACLSPEVLRQIAAARISTPLAYGGGIRCTEDVSRLMDLGCDRFIVESLLFDQSPELGRIADLVGRQALIGSLPLRLRDGRCEVRRPERSANASPRYEPLERWHAHFRASVISEVLVTAADAEGHRGRFPSSLPDRLEDFPDHSIIWFGGLDVSLARTCLALPVTSAVAFGNCLHETELALPRLRRALLTGTDAVLRNVRVSR